MFLGKTFARRFKLLTLLGMSSIFICATLAGSFMQARATNPVNWITNESPVVDKTSATATDSMQNGGGFYAPRAGCINQTVNVVLGFAQEITQTICLTQGKNLRFGVLLYQSNYIPVVSFGADQKVYKLLGVSAYAELIPGTDTLINRNERRSIVFDLNVYDTFSSLIKRDSRELLYTQYVFNPSEVTPYFNSYDVASPDYGNRAFGVGYSSNGRYIAWQSEGENGERYKLLNMQTKDVTTFYTYVQYGGADQLPVNLLDRFTVSNDGTYVASGADGALRIWHINDCGMENIIDAMPFDSSRTCASKSFDRSILGDSYAPQSIFNNLSFSDDNGQLSFYSGYNQATLKYFTLTAPGYVAPKLDYLALGDSYSSGEGDTEMNPQTHQKYYRNWTDNEVNTIFGIPREKCHISTRAYPYLLAKSMNLALDNPKQWDTIACSGAQIPDVNDNNSNYEGQGSRLDSFNTQSLKATALNEFIPGRNEQIEFVKKYKPKVITITMGGNDVGFADTVKACIYAGAFLGTCDAVTPDGRAALGNRIMGIFNDLQAVYRDLYVASGNQAKIYVVGYPQFISDDSNGLKCGPNVGSLNNDEREMINNAVTYMNNVIEAAAKSSGVTYLDVENSLVGHRLCDSWFNTYINGISSIFNNEESFHPNSNGHTAMYNSITADLHNMSLSEYDSCLQSEKNTCPVATQPTSLSYFGNLTSSKTYKYKYMASQEQVSNTPIAINVSSGTFEPNSSVSVVIHSDPINLGQFVVAANGSLGINPIISKDLLPGYHTLILTGKSYSGEPVEFAQVILVKSDDISDQDGDNIDDSNETCIFAQEAHEDLDSDGIDDGCDPVLTISNTPEIKSLYNQNSTAEQRDTNSHRSMNSRQLSLNVSGNISSNLTTLQSNTENQKIIKSPQQSSPLALIILTASLILIVLVLSYAIYRKLRSK